MKKKKGENANKIEEKDKGIRNDVTDTRSLRRSIPSFPVPRLPGFPAANRINNG